MKYTVLSGSLHSTVIASSTEEAIEAAMKNSPPGALSLLIAVQPEGKDTIYVPIMSFLRQRLEVDSRNIYASYITHEDVEYLVGNSWIGLRADVMYFVYGAALALAHIGAKAIPLVIQALDDFALEAREATLQQLFDTETEWMPPPFGMSASMDLLQRPIVMVRVDREIQRQLDSGVPHPCLPPAIALTIIGSECMAPLIAYLQGDKDWLAREAAIGVLGRIADEQAIPCLKGLIRFLSLDRVSRASRKAIKSIKSRAKGR